MFVLQFTACISAVFGTFFWCACIQLVNGNTVTPSQYWPTTFFTGDWTRNEKRIPRDVHTQLGMSERKDDKKRKADVLWLNTGDLKYKWEKVSATQKISKCPAMNWLGDRQRFVTCIRQFREVLIRQNEQVVMKDSEYTPVTFDMPAELGAIPNGTVVFMKRPGLHHGKLQILRNSEDTVKNFIDTRRGEHWIAQVAIDPLLLAGKVFHVRFYVLVTSLDPLRVWTLPESSYIEFAGRNYTKDDGGHIDPLTRISNSGINERSLPEEIRSHPERFWKRIQVLKHELGEGSYADIVTGMQDVVVTTLLGIAKHIPKEASRLTTRRTCFEILGYDFMVDAKGKPMLLEINRSPSMDFNNEVKRVTKTQMLGDAYCIVGLGCEMATVRPGKVTAEEAEDLAREESSEETAAREMKRARRTGAILIWPNRTWTDKYGAFVRSRPELSAMRGSFGLKTNSHTEL
eukprot:TRINITY_DN38760_c0_g1_i1.p1 TRINITY_DN38760_c0_g1~~TRINITY_DN38760_c0_g1_i1.p1  ORF type:complete len:459 (+),score=53.54 TRINITY_DN38760_c0_g1_i1:92-1468(+)